MDASLDDICGPRADGSLWCCGLEQCARSGRVYLVNSGSPCLIADPFPALRPVAGVGEMGQDTVMDFGLE
jgi:hypothetical protein